MRNKIRVIFLTLIVLVGCKTKITKSQYNPVKIEKVCIPNREYSIQAVLWQQNAAEYRALAYQAFNLAKLQLNSILDTETSNKKPFAIITDIDETLLDNSPYSGKQIKLDEEFTKMRWAEWVKRKEAKAIPGSLDFFNYARSKGVDVFYISNRSVNYKQETIENLREAGFPFANASHVLLKKATSGKEVRRLKVNKSHEIILLIGDNLSDFSMVFDNRSKDERNKRVDSLKTNFGKKFIVLPNPTYGDWETDGVLKGKYNWTYFQRDSIRHSNIKSY
ncbi:5'-nucleotidase, lipoprotein e(P4) family [Lutibacter citreus]|uniref:5'-nucleotidase, lipoprotein e(P4) family n=1 Tax=Lutibacter citreus TaxID=2138210 RepID=UPI000DBE9B48|nr:5'-nucleotidase, lipoprotein e(P4) family [Lutibacter citreus]